MGEIFLNYGYRAAYTGAWHLDGYWGDGQEHGGFEPEWWYDGKSYTDDLKDKFPNYTSCKSADDLREHGFSLETIWGHRVADKGVDFLKRLDGGEPFVLAVSFDEPHFPFVRASEYWEQWNADDVPKPVNVFAPIDNKPGLQQASCSEEPGWEGVAKRQARFYACDSYIDREIGRVLMS